MKEFSVALQVIKNRCQPILDNQEELVCLFDTDYKIKHVNDAYCRYFKKSYNELIGINFFELLPKSEHKLVKRKISEITPQNPIAEVTYKIQPHNKTYNWHRWKKIAVFDENGNIVEFQAIGKDITEIKKLKEELLKLKGKDAPDTKSSPSFIGKTAGKKIIINANEICYIKANLINTEVVAPNKRAKVSMQIKEVEKLLENMNFFRIHRSYIVNLDKIKTMESVSESKYKIYFTDISESIISSKRGAKELRRHLKSQG
jgi:PAS domain S-box-containing protein